MQRWKRRLGLKAIKGALLRGGSGCEGRARRTREAWLGHMLLGHASQVRVLID